MIYIVKTSLLFCFATRTHNRKIPNIATRSDHIRSTDHRRSPDSVHSEYIVISKFDFEKQQACATTIWESHLDYLYAARS